jgi:hypothetical protein
MPASGVPAGPGSARAPPAGTTQTSLRFIVPDVNDTGRAGVRLRRRRARPELGVGDDVVMTNVRSGESRCARASADARFRIGMPSNLDDRLEVTIFRGGAVTDYGTCALPDRTPRCAHGDQMEVVEGDCDVHCGHIPPTLQPDARPRRWSQRGAPLRSPPRAWASAGRPRRCAASCCSRRPPSTPATPSASRRSTSCAARGGPPAPRPARGQHHRRPGRAREHRQRLRARRGLDPLHRAPRRSSAPRARRLRHAAGALRPLRRTPNRVLVDRGVLEGLASLKRFPTPTRRDALFDVDDLDEGAQGFGEQRLDQPLRLVRRRPRAATPRSSTPRGSPR